MLAAARKLPSNARRARHTGAWSARDHDSDEPCRQRRERFGLGGSPGESVLRLAALAREARCAGVVCSVAEAGGIKAACGAAFVVLCPGIRPGGSAHGDQRRTATPGDARAAGADYIVVGRPIVEDADRPPRREPSWRS